VVDHAARRVLGVAVDAGQAEGGAGNPHRVAVLAAQVDRPAAARLVEVLAGREGGVGPEVVVPAGAENPRVLGQL